MAAQGYTRTPDHRTLVAPTESDVATYQTGPDKFVNLGPLGGFRNFNITALGADQARFNCFAWSVGFTDRWIQGGTKDDMARLCTDKDTKDEAYMFKQCPAAQAEVELYCIADAPATLSRTIAGRPARPARNGRPAVAATAPRQLTYSNNRALVMHAHRRDFPALDAPNNQGCSSKLAAGPLVAHNRLALADNRGWAQSANPQIVYGSIYQWWHRDPDAHPTFPANAAVQYPVPGHYPDDRIYASGYGTYPPGHPGNTIGLQPPAGNNNAPPGTVRRPGSSASTTSTSSSTKSGHSRNSSATSVSSTNSTKLPAGKAAAAPKAAASKPWVFVAASGRAYPTISLIPPYAPIPKLSAAAIEAASKAATAVTKAKPTLATAFKAAWAAFLAAWADIARSRFCDDAALCTQTLEFAALTKLGAPADLIPLVVHRLATEPAGFVGVFVYNVLQRDAAYLVHKKDAFNYNVLQRHANLVVEMMAVAAPPPKKK
ncbi:hypothetical protein BT67DRAFT_454826 [Trichocladium antarcticum]|uniref:Uncharacterized protein n=1 Tax=Trichocladium antarcticum TaxID=1450529 RepID=A0AAN6ZF54_9PEZI|nr:hypothetical protein BT67DRAFT_454826 [Trichocladium antarcticum]